MTADLATPPSREPRFRRLIGRFETGKPGPTLIVVGGLHGNEPAGVHAADRVMERLLTAPPPGRGCMVAVTGNCEALAAGRRYLDRDLNRAWIDVILERLEDADPVRDRAEDREQRAVLKILRQEMARATEPVVVIDLHSCSGKSRPFAVMSDTLRNRKVALALHVPVFLGLEESVPGTLLEWMTEQGHIGMVVEAGQHLAPESVDIHEAVIWVALEVAGILDRSRIPDRDAWHHRLRQAVEGLPRVVELRRRHHVRPRDNFRMEPGFEGFDPVRKGQLLATDLGGPIRAHEDSLILMPLYQEQGSDGFFLVQPVRRGWLRVSAFLRRLRLARFLPWLPGVRRHPGLDRTLLVDPRIARFYTVEIFHLFGFRRSGNQDGRLIFSRRRPG